MTQQSVSLTFIEACIEDAIIDAVVPRTNASGSVRVDNVVLPVLKAVMVETYRTLHKDAERLLKTASGVALLRGHEEIRVEDMQTALDMLKNVVEG